MHCPWLFDRDALDGIALEIFSKSAVERFGEAARGVASAAQSQPGTPAAEAGILAAWTDALAAEALLLTPRQRIGAPFAGLPDTARPCGAGAPAYGELKRRPAAAALFPLASNSGAPRLARIWAVSGADLAQPDLRLEDPIPLLRHASAAGLRLYADLGADIVTGRSWQLAAALAILALGDQVDDATRLALAADWIITGAVSGDRVTSVAIGNKLEGVHEAGRRTWLYPSADRAAFEQANILVQGKTSCLVPSGSAATVTAAFRTVAGHGSRPEQSADWPAAVGVMHALVGENIAANLAAVLFCPPKELHLWHSSSEKKSRQPAQNMCAILERQIPALKSSIHLHELPTHDLAFAESALEPYLGSVPDGHVVYFNITSSNRMMMLAADRFARNNPRIKLIYRDFDEPGLGYFQIWHEGGIPHTCTLRPKVTPAQTAFLLKLLSSDTKKAAPAALKQIETGELQWPLS